MVRRIILAIFMLLVGLGAAFFVYKSERGEKYPFRLGLDLSGGSHLIYKADVSGISEDPDEALESLRDVIERRINLFGVSEPQVAVQGGGLISGEEHKLLVDLPGVTDVKEAIQMIGETPVLEFKTESPEEAKPKATIDSEGKVTIDMSDQYVSTPLTGRYLKRASVDFNPTTREPYVVLSFDETGTKLFAQITKENIGKTVAIYLDDAPLSTPVVQEEISDGQAVISGNFTPSEAKQLVGRLNSGALPVPISLVSTQTIGPSLGVEATEAGVRATIWGFAGIAVFLIIWYRLPGVVAVVALFIYVSLMLALFKLVPVTLTAAGIAGFIISIGLAVDANVLIFERLKEELRQGRSIVDSTHSGFARAWPAIRDSNIAHIITGIILFWLGTPLIQGFALVFMLGVVISMLSAITITRIFLYALNVQSQSKVAKFLFSSGFSKS